MFGHQGVIWVPYSSPTPMIKHCTAPRASHNGLNLWSGYVATKLHTLRHKYRGGLKTAKVHVIALCSAVDGAAIHFFFHNVLMDS